MNMHVSIINILNISFIIHHPHISFNYQYLPILPSILPIPFIVLKISMHGISTLTSPNLHYASLTVAFDATVLPNTM
jgi:hypothetical protein